jgi:hypothetical protein
MSTTYRFLHQAARATRGLLALLLFGCFIALTPVAVAVWSTMTTVQEPQTFHMLINRGRIAHRSPGFIVHALISATVQHNQSENPFADQFSLRQWEAVAAVILPAEWLEANLHQATEAIFHWLEEPEALLPELTLDLSPIIFSLQSRSGGLAILPLLQNTPVCPAHITTVTYFDGSLVSCLPEEEDITNIAQDVADVIAAGLVSEITIAQLYEEGMIPGEVVQKLNQGRLALGVLNAAINLYGRLLLLILCLYALLYSTSPVQALLSLRLPLLLAGVISLLLLAALLLFVQYGLGLLLTAFVPLLQIELRGLLLDVIQMFLQALWVPWVLVSISLFLAVAVIQTLLFLTGKINARLAMQPAESPRSRRHIRRQFR